MDIRRFALLLICSALQTGCITGVWTGANVIYDRHNIYKKLSDYQLAASVNRTLYKDKMFKRDDCDIDVGIINGDILIAGYVPTAELRAEAYNRIAGLKGYRRIFNQLSIKELNENTMEDNWITTKIRSKILADSTIDPNDFKVVTADQIVYLMGDVIPEQAAKVIHIARTCAGVKRVVKLFKYYNLSDRPNA